MSFINKNVLCRGDFPVKTFCGKKNLTPERKFKTKRLKKKHLDFSNVCCVSLPQFLLLGLFGDSWSPLWWDESGEAPLMQSGLCKSKVWAGLLVAQRGTAEFSAQDLFSSFLWAALQGWEITSKAGKSHPNLGNHIQTQERQTFHSSGVQGDPQQGTKMIWLQPPIEVDGIRVPQPMKVFGKFQPWRLIIRL